MTQTKRLKELNDALQADITFYALGGVPDAELATRSTIKDWHVEIGDHSGVNLLVIRGRIYGDKKLPDGNRFTSHSVLWFDRYHRFVRTTHELHRLGNQAGQEDTDRDPVDGDAA